MALESVSSVGLWPGPSADCRPRAEPLRPWVKKRWCPPPLYDADALRRLRSQADAEADALVARVHSQREAAADALKRQLDEMERRAARKYQTPDLRP